MGDFEANSFNREPTATARQHTAVAVGSGFNEERRWNSNRLLLAAAGNHLSYFRQQIPRCQGGFKQLEIGKHEVAAKSDRPIVHERTDRDHRTTAMFMGFPHFDGRAHGCFGYECNDEIDAAAHSIVPQKNFPATLVVIFQRLPVIGERVIDLRIWDVMSKQCSQLGTIVLIMDLCAEM